MAQAKLKKHSKLLIFSDTWLTQYLIALYFLEMKCPDDITSNPISFSIAIPPVTPTSGNYGELINIIF